MHPKRPRARKLRDFGYDPDETLYYELRLDRAGAHLIQIRDGHLEPVADLDVWRWSQVRGPAERAFNLWLRKCGSPTGRWYVRRPTRLGRSFGKELVCLMWAVEPPLPEALVERAVRCWSHLAVEERWWWATTANATRDQPGFGPSRGWRMALKVALGDWAPQQEANGQE